MTGSWTSPQSDPSTLQAWIRSTTFSGSVAVFTSDKPFAHAAELTSHIKVNTHVTPRSWNIEQEHEHPEHNNRKILSHKCLQTDLGEHVKLIISIQISSRLSLLLAGVFCEGPGGEYTHIQVKYDLYRYGDNEQGVALLTNKMKLNRWDVDLKSFWQRTSS